MPSDEPRLDEIRNRGASIRRRRCRRAAGTLAAVAVVGAATAALLLPEDATTDVATAPSSTVQEPTTTSPTTTTSLITPAPAESTSTTSSTSSTTTTPTDDAVQVTGGSVGPVAFGAADSAVIDHVTSVLGEADSDSGWRQFTRRDDRPGPDGEARYYEDPNGDGLGPGAFYPWTRRVCWEVFCVELGGEDPGAGTLRGWSLDAVLDPVAIDAEAPAVLEPGGLSLGSTWAEVRAAYPTATAGGGEGGSLVVDGLPFPTIFDGVGGWRLTGSWDHTRPDHAPDEARLQRLSAGDGPEPGCC